MKERERHRLIFEKYAAQGAGRSLARLSKEEGIPLSTLKAWSRDLRWGDRLEQRAKAVAETVAKTSVQSEADEQVQDQQVVRLALFKVAKAVAEDRIRPTLGDLDRMLRLKRELAEAGRERTSQEFTVTWGNAAGEDDPKPEDRERATSVEEAQEELRREVERLERDHP